MLQTEVCALSLLLFTWGEPGEKIPAPVPLLARPVPPASSRFGRAGLQTSICACSALPRLACSPHGAGPAAAAAANRQRLLPAPPPPLTQRTKMGRRGSCQEGGKGLRVPRGARLCPAAQRDGAFGSLLPAARAERSPPGPRGWCSAVTLGVPPSPIKAWGLLCFPAACSGVHRQPHS